MTRPAPLTYGPSWLHPSRPQPEIEGTLTLHSDSGEVKSMFGDAGGRQQVIEMLPLSEIVTTLNERFGLYLTDADQLLFDQFEEGCVTDDELGEQARNNTLENFRLVFDRKFLNTIVSRMDANDAIFKRVLDDADFQAVLADYYLRRVYGRLRETG